MILAAFVTWAVNSERGTRMLLSWSQDWLPAGLSWHEVHGTLAGPLQIRGLRFHDPASGLDLTVESASLDLAPWALLARRLHVEHAAIEGVGFAMEPAPTSSPPPPQRDPWEAPLSMRFDDVQLVRAEWRRTESPPLVITRARLAGRWYGTTIEATQLLLESPDGTLDLAARISPQAPMLEQLRGNFRWRVGEHVWAGKLSGAREHESLELVASLELPVVAQLRSTISPARQTPGDESWRAQLSVGRFNPDPLVHTEAFDSVALELEALGTLQDLALRGELSLGDDQLHLENLLLAWRDSRLQLSELRAGFNAQAGVLTGNASLALAGNRPSSARLTWEEIRLPDAWAGANLRCAGQVAATLEGERFAVNGRARLARHARESTLSFAVDGTKNSLRMTEVELIQERGNVSIQGDVTLGETLRWKLDAVAHAFDPSLFLETWPGAVDFDLHSTGQWDGVTPRAHLRIDRLAGELRGRKLAGSGEVSLDRDSRPSGRAQLRSGDTSLDIIASPAPSPTALVRLRIPNLEEWRADLRGAVSAEMRSSGRWPGAEFLVTAEASRFRRENVSAESATLRIDARDLRALRGTVALAVRGLAIDDFRFDEAQAHIDGEQAAHRITLDARGEPLTVQLEGNGGLRGDAWTGQIDALRIEAAKAPPLALRQSARLSMGGDTLSLEDACLQGGEISLCINGTHQRRESAFQYSIHSLPLSVVAALAAPAMPVSVEGLLEGQGELRREADGTLGGKATLSSSRGALVQGTEQDAMRLAWRNLEIVADLGRELGQATLRGILVDQGEIDGSFSIAIREHDPALAGNARAGMRDLSPLAWWVPQLAQMQGSGSVSVALGGTLGAPRLAFDLQARDLEAEVPLLGLHLKDGNLHAGLESDGSLLADGRISSGDGTLRLTATRSASEELSVKLGGERILAANIPGARVVIAPDLALTGRLGALSLTGRVILEDADVNLEKLSLGGAAQTSSDVVVVDREQRVRKDTPGLSTDVRIILGSHVKLAGYGLESTVSGELQVTEKPGDASRASGEIRVAGTYEAFGRKLTIERGSLQYASTVLDDPQLDILAVRKLQDVTAKLRVSGSAKQPRLDVFAEPAMSQTDAMSYLITGQSASDLHGEDSAAVQSAAQQMGTVLGNRLAKRFGGKMGFVDQVGVEQNTDLGGSAFTVGKYLSPRLFVSYGIGLFEPGNAVTVRYQFSERWSLEANDTPEDQHAGIRYRIEK